MLWFLFILVLVLISIPIVIERHRKPISRAMRADAPGRFAELSQGVTHYQWAGPDSGQHIVCIHGLTSPSYVWAGLVKGFILMGFRVLTYDLYGRGLSACPSGAQDSAFFRKQLEDLLEAQSVDDDAIIVGYSMGGAIAVDYASAYPEKVQRLILLATAGLGQTLSPFVKLMIKVPVIGDGLMYTFGGKLFGRSTNAMDAAKAAAPNMQPWPIEKQQSQGFLPAVLSGYRNILSENQMDAHRVISEAGIPVLAVWAEEDKAVPLSAMGRLAVVNREAFQEVISGADHRLPYSHPREIITVVQEFLREAV